jgi:MarR family transcriptional regulator for hemolysin
MNSAAGEQSIEFLLADISRLTRKLADRRLTAIGLTRVQCHALMSLDRFGPLAQAALAEVMDVGTATIARLLARMEGTGWIERSGGQRDRRVKLVSTTDKTAAIMDCIVEIATALDADMGADLTRQQSETLTGSMGVMKSRLNQLLAAE